MTEDTELEQTLDVTFQRLTPEQVRQETEAQYRGMVEGLATGLLSVSVKAAPVILGFCEGLLENPNVTSKMSAKDCQETQLFLEKAKGLVEALRNELA